MLSIADHNLVVRYSMSPDARYVCQFENEVGFFSERSSKESGPDESDVNDEVKCYWNIQMIENWIYGKIGTIINIKKMKKLWN